MHARRWWAALALPTLLALTVSRDLAFAQALPRGGDRPTTAPRGSQSMPMPMEPDPGTSRMPPGDATMAMPMPMPAGPQPSPVPATGRTAPAARGFGLALCDLEAMALHNNPTLVQAQAQVDASLSKSFQAGLLPNPIAGYVSEQIGAGSSSLGETQGWFAEQEIPRGGKLRLSRAKYRQEAAQAQIQVQAQQMRVVNGVRAQYYEVLAAQRLLEVERDLLGNFEEMLRTTRELVNLGQANRPDLLQAQVAAQRQRVTVRATENRLRKSWVDLTTLIGAAQLPFGPLADVLEEDGPPLNWDTAYQQILACSPELAVARAEVLRDEITVQRERVQPVPNLFARVENGYNFEVNLVTTGVSIGWNFPILNRNQGTISEAMAEVTRARAEVARLELVLRRRLAEVFTHYETARATVQTYRAETLPQAREAYDLTLDGYRQRRTPWAQVVLAQRTLSDLSEDYIEALLHLRQAEVAIRGMLLVDGLSQPEPPTPGGHIDAVPQPR
jgi:cobalt-zinc-cadmium efflux system outer membrane protein